MAKRTRKPDDSEINGETYNPDNGGNVVTIKVGDPPADDFDPDKNLQKVIALNAKVGRLKERHEEAKNSLKETEPYNWAKSLGEELKGAASELDELLAELGREYPLFRRASGDQS